MFHELSYTCDYSEDCGTALQLYCVYVRVVAILGVLSSYPATASSAGRVSYHTEQWEQHTSIFFTGLKVSA